MSASGFRGAPITKGLFLAGVSSSVILQAASTSRHARRIPLLVSAFTHVFAFRQAPSELIFGSALLYYCRTFERLQGSTKFGSFVAITCALAYALEAAIAAAGGPVAASGLTPLVFALLPACWLDVPPLHSFSFFGRRMTDKVFIYLAAFQLLLSGHRRSLAAGVCGAVAGLLYRINAFGVARLRLPAVLVSLFSSSLGRVLTMPADRQQVFLSAPPPQQSGAVPSGRQPREPRPPAVQPAPEAVEQLVAMGFEPGAARRALQEAGNNVELALQHLL
eukprot:scaffold2.g7533.t1